jgi:alpha-1,3-rhamnosyl/mannosyltransferase
VKIVVNIHCLHPPLTGIGHYARHLLLELLSRPEVEVVEGVSGAGWHGAAEVQEILNQDNGYEPAGQVAPPRPSLPRRLARRVPGAGRLRAAVNHRLQVRERRRHADFVYWEPNYLLLPVQLPALATVHDLSHLRYPQFHPESRLSELGRLPDSLRRARRVATVSEFSRRELASFFSLDPADIDVVPPAVSPAFRPREPAELAEVRSEFGLPPQFLLYAGTIEPRKNLPRLLQAFCSLPLSLQEEFPLVLAGGEGWHPEGFEEAIAALDTRHVIRLGYVPGSRLGELFSAATALAYPSLYEGFGMPVLEAMASGTPVLTANAASMPEVAGGAALLVDPLSPDDIAAGLRRLLEGPALRARMAARGLEVAAGHSWSRSADRLVSALARVAAP